MPRYAVYALDEPAPHEPPHLVSLDAMVVDAIRKARPWSMTASEGHARLLVTLAAGGEVRYVVELEGDFDPADARRWGLFASIASRYFERLVDAETDPLTRLANRRAFHSQLDTGLRRWVAGGRPYYFAVLDVDHFKRINDQWGHLYGDEILVRFAQLLRETMRAGDLLYRFGGEEFVLIYSTDNDAGGLQTLERFRAVVESYPFPGIGRVSVSIGFTRIAEATMPASLLIERADKAMYFAKEHGRNRVCSWEGLVASGEIAAPAGRVDVTLF
jgi:diguanylate cyclase (GGDEF)-like protein